jgi:hypothetical protein
MGAHSLAEAPTRTVHVVQVLSNGRMISLCGREADESWKRIAQHDQAIFGKGPRSIREMLPDLRLCALCLPRS